MNDNDWTEFERFAFRERSAVWSDFERVRDLRKMLRSILARLDALKCHPVRNAEFIQMEEAMAARTGRELERLESQILLM